MAEAKTPRERTAAPARPVERRARERLRSRTLADGKLQDPRYRPSSFLGSTIDLSLGGAQIRTYEALEQGARVVLILRLPEGDVAATGMVTHVTVDPIGCTLAGIRFDPLVAESAELLVAHLHAFQPRPRFVAGDDGTATEPVATKLPVTGRIASHRAPR